MAEIIKVTDLPATLQSAELVEVMVEGLNARASRVAPCLAPEPPETVDPAKLAEAKLILIGIIKRWVEAGSGAAVQQQMGPFAMTTDTRQRGGWKLWPSDIADLQDICKTITGTEGKAFTVSLGPSCGSAHVPWCNLNLGADWCSCGTDIAGEPIYEVD